MKRYMFLMFALLLAPLSAQAVDCYPVGVEPQHIRMDGTLFNIDEVAGYRLYSDRDQDGVFVEEDYLPVDGAVTKFCPEREATTYFFVGVSLYDTEGHESERNYTIVYPASVPLPGESSYPRAPGFACVGAGC